MSLLDNTRIGEMFSSLSPENVDSLSPSEIHDRIDTAQRMVAAAMGAEYLLMCMRTGHRGASEALQHWLSFLSLINPTLFGSTEKLDKLRPILRNCLKDIQDIQSGKIQ